MTWTDEQYIDWLFNEEPCGYQDTPGFRDFLLELMATIGERPRAGDVSSMHLAYTAGLEHGKEWTDERPAKAGEYWLSIPPDRRRGVHEKMRAVYVRIGERVKLHVWDDLGLWLGCLDDSYFDGAKWSRLETPADPFAKTEMRTDQDGREYNHDDREQKLNPDALVKKAIQHLRKRKPKNGRGCVYPLWKRVADLFGHGSGYSAEICRRHGFDPDEKWKPE